MIKNLDNILIFDLTPSTIDGLPNIIELSVKTNKFLKVFSSVGDNSDLELCELQQAVSLFQRACIQYGLLGYYKYVGDKFPKGIISQELKSIAITTCSVITNKDYKTKEFDSAVDMRKFNFMRDLSCNKFKQLFDEFHIDDNIDIVYSF